jgi:hypothetical protein
VPACLRKEQVACCQFEGCRSESSQCREPASSLKLREVYAPEVFTVEAPDETDASTSRQSGKASTSSPLRDVINPVQSRLERPVKHSSQVNYVD